MLRVFDSYFYVDLAIPHADRLTVFSQGKQTVSRRGVGAQALIVLIFSLMGSSRPNVIPETVLRLN